MGGVEKLVVEAAAYIREHPDCGGWIASGVVTSSGYTLGAHANGVRARWRVGNLTNHQTDSLRRVGFAPEKGRWDVCIRAFGKFMKTHPESAGWVPRECTVDRIDLGVWADNLRARVKKPGGVPAERFKELNGLGFAWTPAQTTWERFLLACEAYLRQHPAADGWILHSAKVDGYSLGGMAHLRRKARTEGRLSKEEIADLDGIRFAWVRPGEVGSRR